MRISDWSSDVCSSDLAQRQILRDAISTSSMAPQDERSFLTMPLYHNDDQTMLKDSVAPFVAEQAPVSHLRSLRDSADATGFRSEEHTSELQSLMRITYAVFCLKKKTTHRKENYT